MEQGQVKNYNFILIKCIYKILIIFMSRNMTKSTDGKTNRNQFFMLFDYFPEK